MTLRSAARPIWTGLLTVVALAAPAALLGAAVAVRVGPWSATDVHAPGLLNGLWILCLVSSAAAVGVVLAALLNRRRWRAALAALLGAGFALAITVQHRIEIARGDPADVTTAPSEPPALAVSGGSAGCDGLASLPTQVRVETAARALQSSGFSVGRATLFNVTGAHDSFWLGVRYEAAVRIRPGRTDVRVAAREPAADAGGACRLARKIIAAMSEE